MAELAFRVKPDSEFYQKYQEAEAEKKKFAKLGQEFLQRSGLDFIRTFCVGERLIVELTQEQAESLSGELLKERRRDGYYIFRKRSKYQLQWQKEVVPQVDFKLIDSISLWYFGYIYRGSYAMWEYEGTVYGLMVEKLNDKIKMADWMDPIPMSEYYRVIEDAEAKRRG